MKIKELANCMNDQGTKPRIRVIAHRTEYSELVYEGRPDSIDKELGACKVNSFTVLGKGLMEIHVS